MRHEHEGKPDYKPDDYGSFVDDYDDAIFSTNA